MVNAGVKFCFIELSTKEGKINPLLSSHAVIETCGIRGAAAGSFMRSNEIGL
jgi:hypothetical protein